MMHDEKLHGEQPEETQEPENIVIQISGISYGVAADGEDTPPLTTETDDGEEHDARE